MEKGQHGYMNRHKRNVLISIIVLGLFVIAGVFFTVAMFDTRKTVFIVIPIPAACKTACGIHNVCRVQGTHEG